MGVAIEYACHVPLFISFWDLWGIPLPSFSISGDVDLGAMLENSDGEAGGEEGEDSGKGKSNEKNSKRGHIKVESTSGALYTGDFRRRLLSSSSAEHNNGDDIGDENDNNTWTSPPPKFPSSSFPLLAKDNKW